MTSRERMRCVPTRTSTFPSWKSVEDPLLVGAASEARHHVHPHGKVAIPLAERVPVLLGQDRRRAEDERLPAVERDPERSAHGHLRLPEADVAADEPIHRPVGFEVLLDRLDRLQLVVGLAVRERALEPLEPVVPEVERVPRRLPALGVEGEELAGELSHRRARAALEVLPGLAAELRERRRLRVGPDVARDLRDLLVRDVEPVLALEGEEEVVARDAGDVLRLEAEETPDAVVLVDDVVADAEVGEGLQRATETRVGARRPLAEDLRVRQQRDSEVAPDEPAAGGADDEGERRVGGELLDAVDDVRLDLPQEPLRPQRLALVRERHEHASTLAHHARELVLGLGEAAGGDRGTLRLEHVLLRAREGIEARGAVDVRRGEALLLPDTRDVVELPDDVGRAVEQRDEVVRSASSSTASSGSRCARSRAG